MIDYLSDAFKAQSLPQVDAAKSANDIVLKLSMDFAGETIYVNKKPQVFVRQMAMYADLQVMPSAEVDRKYGVSKGYSLKVAKKIKQQRQMRPQLQFPEKI